MSHGHSHEGDGCGSCKEAPPPMDLPMEVTGPAFYTRMEDVEEVNVFRAARYGWTGRIQQLMDSEEQEGRRTSDRGLIFRTYGKTGGTPLHVAALNGQADTIKFLISKGANPSEVCPGAGGAQPIHWAVTGDNVKAVSLLLSVGADINARNSKMMTPLMIASEKKQANVVAFLIASGADLHATDAEGDNALHWAAQAGDVNVVRLLLSAGLSPSSLDNFLQTPLHLASVGNSHQACLSLLQHAESSADVDGKTRKAPLLNDVDRNGHTPLSLALRRGPSHAEVANVIKSFNAPKWSLTRLVRHKSGLLMADFYWVVGSIIMGYTAYFTNVYPSLTEESSGWHSVFLFLQLPMWVCFYYNMVCDAGIVKPASALRQHYWSKLRSIAQIPDVESSSVEQVLSQLCTTCQLVRQPRVKHCPKCNVCIKDFDHHCDFTLNCIGYRNRTVFFAMMVLLVMTTTLMTIWMFPYTTNEHGSRNYLATVAFLMMFLSFLFCVWLSSLLFYLVLNGMTMNEYYNSQRYKSFKNELGSFHNPYNNGWLRNLMWFFCQIDKSTKASKERESLMV